MNLEEVPKSTEAEIQTRPRGSLNRLRSFIQSRVNESRLPTQEGLGYESTVGIYGGKLVTDEEGKLVYDTRGIISWIDQKGDIVLRTFDEHLLKDPVVLLKRHPKWFFKLLVTGPKRYRGTRQEIVQNVNRLGLSEYYGLHKWGIEIKHPEIFQNGRALQDIYRADLINSPALSGIDRFQALSAATKYIKTIHTQYGGVGELLTSDIIFQQREEGVVAKPVLNIPDLVYNSDKGTQEADKKATDLLDFMFNVGVEELRRSRDWNQVKRALQTITESYQDPRIFDVVGSFAKRGRLVLVGDKQISQLPETISNKIRPLASQHNQARLGVKEDFTRQLRELIIEICSI